MSNLPDVRTKDFSRNAVSVLKGPWPKRFIDEDSVAWVVNVHFPKQEPTKATVTATRGGARKVKEELSDEEYAFMDEHFPPA